MNEKVENLILEHLRAIRSDIARLSEKVDTLAASDLSMKQHMAGFMGQELVQDGRLAQFDIRLERIERRLEISETK
jgi:hypothetical protein